MLNPHTTEPALEQLALGDLAKSLLMLAVAAVAISLLIVLVLGVATALDKSHDRKVGR